MIFLSRLTSHCCLSAPLPPDAWQQVDASHFQIFLLHAHSGFPNDLLEVYCHMCFLKIISVYFLKELTHQFLITTSATAETVLSCLTLPNRPKYEAINGNLYSRNGGQGSSCSLILSVAMVVWFLTLSQTTLQISQGQRSDLFLFMCIAVLITVSAISIWWTNEWTD
jgi:hypothetical protein